MSDLIVSFRGNAADRHVLPAYEASQSLYGISRSALIVLNFLMEGRVRRKGFDPSENRYSINMVTHRPGSFEFVFEVLADPSVRVLGQAVASKVTGDIAMMFIKSVFNRCIGGRADEAIENLEESRDLNPGDLGALVEAVEPAMRAAHTAVNNGATQILLINGSNNIVNLNARTKAFVKSSRRLPRVKDKILSVASYNSNTRYGRVYDYEYGMTFPFEHAASIDRTSLSNMMKSMTAYAMRRHDNYDEESAKIAVRFEETVAPDGRVKKIHLLKARREILALR